MNAAAKREGISEDIFKVEDDGSADEDSAFSAETRVGEHAYQAIAQLMSFAPADARAVETLPPPSLEPPVESGVRRALRETPTIPAPPMPSTESSDEPPLEQTQLLVASASGPSVVPLGPQSGMCDKRMEPITLPSMLGSIMHASASPIAITVVDAPTPPAIVEEPRRWRFFSSETLIFAFAFSATVAFVLGTAWFFMSRR